MENRFQTSADDRFEGYCPSCAGTIPRGNFSPIPLEIAICMVFGDWIPSEANLQVSSYELRVSRRHQAPAQFTKPETRDLKPESYPPDIPT